MVEIRVRPINQFYHADFLSRVFREMCQGELTPGRFNIGHSLSWQGFQLMASPADLADVCTQALDFREPNVRPDRKRFTAFRLSLGTRLLKRDLPFTRKQLCVLGDSLVMQLRQDNEAFPMRQVGALLKARVKAI